MRYVFIINPTAGKVNPAESYFPKVAECFDQHQIPYTVRMTEYPKHATEIVREEAADGQPVRIIAVGGDGTLCEVANGAIGLPNVEVGLIPCGSGNDYLRVYGTKEDFLNPERLIAGTATDVDMIDNEFMPSLNICSCGIDSQVALDMKNYKKIPMVSGSMAYNIALVKAFLGKLGTKMRITVDGKLIGEKRYLLAVAAVGKYYGGGYCASPASILNDGLLDIVLVTVPKHRLQIPGLLNIYKAGKHLTSEKFAPLLTYLRGKKVTMEMETDAAINSDGECRAMRKITFTIREKAIRFILPQGCDRTALA